MGRQLQKAAFAFADDDLYFEDSTLPHRYGSVLCQALRWSGIDGSGAEVRLIPAQFVKPF